MKDARSRPNARQGREGGRRTPSHTGDVHGGVRHTRWVILRDLVIFHLKLALDGLKDVVLAPLSLGAAVLDLAFPGTMPGHRFYRVLRAGERFDRWLSLFSSPSDTVDARSDGLFGASRAGAHTLLGRLEELVLGREEPTGTGAPRP